MDPSSAGWAIAGGMTGSCGSTKYPKAVTSLGKDADSNLRLRRGGFGQRAVPGGPRDERPLKVVCRAGVAPIPYTLAEPAQVSVAARFRSGSTEYCAVLGGTVARDQTGVAFVAHDAGPPSSCPAPPASSP